MAKRTPEPPPIDPSEGMPGQYTWEGTHARLGLFAGGIARARRDRTRPGLRWMAWIVTVIAAALLVAFLVAVVAALAR